MRTLGNDHSFFSAPQFKRDPLGSGRSQAMPQGFIVIQIGNEQLDRLYTDAIVPALIACGLDPKRVDKHNGASISSRICFLRSARTTSPIVPTTKETVRAFTSISPDTTFCDGVPTSFRNFVPNLRSVLDVVRSWSRLPLGVRRQFGTPNGLISNAALPIAG